MRKYYLILVLLTTLSSNLNGQSCNELMEIVKTKDFGITLYSLGSSSISSVSFHQFSIDYKMYYFAVVCFKNGFLCSEYIYQVGPTTYYDYLRSYHSSAGKAYWSYIHPYKDVLGCAP